MDNGCKRCTENRMMNEEQLITGCRKGDRTAQKELYELYSPRMLGVCLRYIGDKETARDVLQDGFVKVFSSFGGYKGEGPLGAWIRRIFVNESLEHLRRKTNVYRNTVDIDSIADYSTNEETAVSKLSADDLMHLIQSLPNSLRAVFNLFAIEGYSHKEIAGMLHIEESTSRSQYMRARRWLQNRIK